MSKWKIVCNDPIMGSFDYATDLEKQEAEIIVRESKLDDEKRQMQNRNYEIVQQI